jgi:hypothetical protein
MEALFAHLKFWIPVLLIGGGIGWLVVSASAAERKTWQEYVVSHHCEVKGYIEGHSNSGTGIGTDGKLTIVNTYTPRQTRWLCDEGEEIYK